MNVYEQRSLGRLLGKIDQRGEDECWPWTAGLGGTKERRPVFWFRSKQWQASRVLWVLLHDAEIPVELFVCHTCDNGICMNPKHFFLGTHTDNVRDMHQKGRNWNAQVSECPRGHSYSLENTYIYGTMRHCRVCNRESHARRKAAQNAAV